MSLMFSARRNSTNRSVKRSDEIAKRDMSQRKKVIRKVQELGGHGKIEITKAWTIELPSQTFRISFSRDNLHVWVNGKAVETTSYITDQGYDVDLFFAIADMEGHIYSDVEGNEMMNYLLLNGEIKGTDYQTTDMCNN
ncbi:hypothetical protein ACF0H5_020665 [Mactra antiquata]